MTYLKVFQYDKGDIHWIEDGITILSPTKKLTKLANKIKEYRHLSYVLRLEFSGIRIMIGGAASSRAWKEILRTCGKDKLKSDFFIAPCHLKMDKTSEKVFKYIQPEHIILPCCEDEKYESDYFLNLAKKFVWCTNQDGTLTLTIDEYSEYKIETEKGNNYYSVSTTPKPRT